MGMMDKWSPQGMIDSGVGMGLNLLFGGIMDNRQYKQQEKYQQLQIQGAKEMADYNQGLGIQMAGVNAKIAQNAQDRQNAYNDPSQQVSRLENAGLNVGLAMGGSGGGGGGTTQAVNPQGGGQGTGASPGMATAPNNMGMAMQLGIQKAMAEADIKLKASQANAQDAEAEATRGYRQAKSQWEVSGIQQNIAQSQAQTALINSEKTLKDIISKREELSTPDLLKQIKENVEQTIAQTKHIKVDNEYQQATLNARIEYTKTLNAEQAMRLAIGELEKENIGADTKLKGQQVQESMQRIMNMERQLIEMDDYKEMREQYRKIDLEKNKMQKEMVDFTTSAPAQIKQYTDIITSFLPFRSQTTTHYNETYDEKTGTSRTSRGSTTKR